ncbi:protein kinase/ LuxR family transcriptional regulator [Minicystis rosea]|nr:protein kinase/ LuxR family transcriptional regulator [Minicystis rosea]
MTIHPDVPTRGAFVGRTRELGVLGRSHDEGARLVTVTGPAGMGKTRLSLEWARSALGPMRRDGSHVLFCDLSDARSLDDACAIVARSLAVPLAAGGSTVEAVDQLGRALASSGVGVLILDNLEQLVADAPRLVEPWLAQAPAVRFVLTSRERLRIVGEVCLPVEPLTVPPEGARELAEIAGTEAVALFVDRARAARPGFELSAGDAVHVAAIVRQLDGIPLAIELCAARAGMLSPQQILTRLARRFELLAQGARGAPARQATLRGALDWSWELLDRRERSALAQCAVFRGGFSLEAAEGVIDLREGPDDAPPPVLDVLQALHEKSLLRAFDAPATRRYGLLESIRAYAEERLDSMRGTAAAAARHASFFLAPTRMGGAPILRANDVRRLALEVENLIVVATRALARRPILDADTALRALLLMEPVLLLCARGRLEPYATMLDAALEAEGASVDPVVRARALYTRALADLVRGRVIDCMLRFQRSLEAARAAESRADMALALTKTALLLDRINQVDEARSRFAEARAIALDLGDPALVGDWMLTYGGALLWRGRAAEAEVHAESAVESLHAAGDLRGQSVASAQLAQARLSLGRLDDAERAAAEAQALLDAIDDRRTEGYVLSVEGRIAEARGRFPEARASLSAALAIHRAVGDRWSESLAHGYLGNVAFEEGRLDEAASAYREATALLHNTGEQHYVAVFAAALGAVAIAQGRDDDANAHFKAATRAADGARSLSTKAAVDVFCGFGDVALARRAAAEGDAEATDRHRRAALARIALARSPAPDGALAPALSAEDVRLAVRLLERALAEHEAPIEGGAARLPRAPQPSSSAVPMLVVGPEARWFRVQDGDPVRLLKARAARLVLFRLVRRRLEAPGRALTLEALFEAGWPGERIPRPAASNRVHVTLTKLRRLGLAGLLLSRDDGFLLDPASVVLEALDLDPG